MKKIKVLEVVPSLTRSNGITTFLLNYQRTIDKNKFDITYLIVRDRGIRELYPEFEKNGAKIVEIFLDDGAIGYSKRINNFFKDNHFDVVHCNTPNIAFIVLKYAKKNGVPVRINHAHGIRSSEKRLNQVRNDLLIKKSKEYTTHFFSCSKKAGTELFGKVPFIVINNAINYKSFMFNDKTRANIRKRMGVENRIIIGNVGRYQESKNQQYIVKIMSLLRDDDRYIAWIIGGGKFADNLNRQIEKEKLKKRVFILGCRNDVSQLYNAMDIFVLPSTNEGFPVVGVEAQVNGLPCMLSKAVTEECKISDTTIFLPIGDNNLNKWTSAINKLGIPKRTSNIDDRLDIEKSVLEFEKLLATLVEGGKNER